MSPAWRACSISNAEAPDPRRPVICFDESPLQLIGEVRQPIPPKPAQIERRDCDYRRNGTARQAPAACGPDWRCGNHAEIDMTTFANMIIA
jgi:hypothetical protein